jgi:hypothetical protein
LFVQTLQLGLQLGFQTIYVYDPKEFLQQCLYADMPIDGHSHARTRKGLLRVDSSDGGGESGHRCLLVACNSDIGIELMYHEACLKESFA